MEELNEKQIMALEELLKGTIQTKIAEMVGVHVNTIKNWKHNEAFKAELTRRRKEAVQYAQNVMAGKAQWAAQRIIDMVDDPDATTVMFKAACKVYDSAVAGTMEEFEERLLALEEFNNREV